jgi:hypothetical protein
MARVNGYNVVGSAAQEMMALKAAFRDRKQLCFRCFPQTTGALRWQAGRIVAEPVTMADGSVELLERFELVGFAATSAELIDQLA